MSICVFGLPKGSPKRIGKISRDRGIVIAAHQPLVAYPDLRDLHAAAALGRAMPCVYHASLTKNRSSIRRDGLRKQPASGLTWARVGHCSQMKWICSGPFWGIACGGSRPRLAVVTTKRCMGWVCVGTLFSDFSPRQCTHALTHMHIQS